MAKINWTTQAWDELAEINDKLSAYSDRYADFVVDSILNAANNLTNFPRLGRVVPELKIPKIREIIVEKYRIVYFLDGDDVQILTIRHSSRPLSDTIFPS